MKIGLGGDNNAFTLKTTIKEYLEDKGIEVKDYGCYSEDAVDYPDVAFEVAEAVSQEEVDRGILICGTGIGVCVAANKYPGIRAALAHDEYSAERAQLSNNAQILTMGAQIIGPEVAKKVVDAYVRSEWAEGSKRKVDKIIDKEKNFISQNYQDVVSKGC
ncbi:ribose 5-phosphate isomerase B [Gracilibacillus sp. YIM 98692]|uniref:ribose 5-phosphate isomerase B n=1 Tax=Gracilibacillus sp. YIM 98692 TaxID=2663532 RepID=UPI0013D2483B|nr:ribose 5-phosphate isomerase B [Gracilibacillus sp. YIM 98692]